MQSTFDFTEKTVMSMTNPNISYVINLVYKTCTCPSFQYRKGSCKHLKAEGLDFNRVDPRKEFPDEL